MTTRTILTICAAVGIAGVIAAGTMIEMGKAGAKTPMVEQTPINDSWLTSKATIAMFADARVKGSEIKVETTQGAMMIRGKVDSKDARQAAEGIAKGIEGVTSVKNPASVFRTSFAAQQEPSELGFSAPRYITTGPLFALKGTHTSMRSSCQR